MTDKPRFISQATTGRDRKTMASARTEIYERDNYTCQYCLKEFDRSSLTLEHVVPVNKSGIDDLINYITACRSCNSSKQDATVRGFLNRRDDLPVNADDLPIHGDLVLDTVELPLPYRETRLETYIHLRETGSLSGSKAYKQLEKNFRRNLWKTEYGEKLQEAHPNIPGHVLASFPIVEYLEPDPDVPIQAVLLEFCKSAQTRSMVDEMVRRVDLDGGVSRSDSVRDVIAEGMEGDESRQKRIVQAMGRAGVKSITDEMFNSQSNTTDSPVPVEEGKRYDVEIVDSGKEGDGIAKIEGFVLIIPDANVGDHVTVEVTSIKDTVAFTTLIS